MAVVNPDGARSAMQCRSRSRTYVGGGAHAVAVASMLITFRVEGMYTCSCSAVARGTMSAGSRAAATPILAIDIIFALSR